MMMSSKYYKLITQITVLGRYLKEIRSVRQTFQKTGAALQQIETVKKLLIPIIY
jgi:hypothetical protein